MKPKSDLEIQCNDCGTIVDKTEFNGDTNNCNECHDQIDFDECGCPRCYDKLVSAADFYEQD